jgi:hypothetical protein
MPYLDGGDIGRAQENARRNVAARTHDLFEFLAGTTVSVVERCTAMDGTWGMENEFYPVSLEFARKTVDQMQASAPDTFATDCSLAALQIEAVRGSKPAHPASLLREADGLPEERSSPTPASCRRRSSSRSRTSPA